MPPRLQPALILLAIALAWSGVLGAGFFWDDRFLVVSNPSLADFDLARVFSTDLWDGAAGMNGQRSPYFRPLMTLSLMADRAFFGLEPGGYHLHNLAWHLAAVGALFALVRSRLGPARAAVAALIFGLHPIQSEAVAWIAARNDLMCAAFTLAALGAFDRRRDALGAAAVLGACLSKEPGAFVPVLLVLWRLGWGERPRGRELVAAGVACAIFLALRARAELGSVVPAPMDPAILATVPGKLVVTYLGWLTLPWPLTSAASAYRVPSPVAWASAVVTVGAIGLLVRASPRRGLALVGMAALLWAPTLGSTVATHAFGERFLYGPLAVLAVLVAAAVPDRRPTWVAGGVAALAAIAALALRIPDWRDEGTMWEQAVARAPDGFSRGRLASWREENGDVRGAFQAWRAAMDEVPLLRLGCAEPVRLLLEVGAAVPAAEMSDHILERGCVATDTKGWRFRALVSAGRYAEAAAEVPTRPWSDAEVPYVAALCMAAGNLSCAQQLALAWPDGPADLRGRIQAVSGL